MKPNAKFVVQTYSRLLNWTSLPLSLSLTQTRSQDIFPLSIKADPGIEAV